MNLLEQYILEVISKKDCTEEWETYMRSHGKPDYKAEEPYFEVICRENCYGSESIQNHMWRKSEFEKYKEQGYYMG